MFCLITSSRGCQQEVTGPSNYQILYSNNGNSKKISNFLGVSACNAQYPTQETISEMPFGFWYIFQDDMIACEPPQFQLGTIHILRKQKT